VVTGTVPVARFQSCLIGVHYRWVFLMAVLKNVVNSLTAYSIERVVSPRIEEIAASIGAATLVMDQLCMRLVGPVPVFVWKLLAS